MADEPTDIDWSTVEATPGVASTEAATARERSPRRTRTEPHPSRDPATRPALVVFGGLLALTAVLVLGWLGRDRWFIRDDWDFLAARHLNLAGLFDPHNEHWVTLPVIAWRFVYALVGLHSYRAYQVLIVATHLAVVALLRAVMRRAGVGPWMATVMAGSLLLFGSGAQNIVSAFQITFVGSLAFGLVQLLLAGHEGALDRRDWLGLLAGAAALMCSGVGVTMVVVVGVAAWLRRGWRVAAFHVVPLAAMYVAWWIVERPQTRINPFGAGAFDVVRGIWDFSAAEVTGTFDGMGGAQYVGFVVAAVVIGGVGLAIWSRGWSASRRQLADVAGLVVGAAVFAANTAAGRWFFGAAYAIESRYIYLVAAMFLPAAAVAADALVRRWSLAAPALAVLLAVCLVANARIFIDGGHGQLGSSYLLQRQIVLAEAGSDELATAPADLQLAPSLTAGWLRSAVRQGKAPPDRSPSTAVASEVAVQLAFVARAGPAPSTTCRTLTTPIEIRSVKGQVFGIYETTLLGSLVVRLVLPDGKLGTPVPFSAFKLNRLDTVVGGLHLRFGIQAGHPIRLCTH